VGLGAGITLHGLKKGKEKEKKRKERRSVIRFAAALSLKGGKKERKRGAGEMRNLIPFEKKGGEKMKKRGRAANEFVSSLPPFCFPIGGRRKKKGGDRGEE